MGCLDEETAIALVQGELASQEASDVHRHVDGCEACRLLLAALAKMPTIRRTELEADVAPEQPVRIAERYDIGPVLGAGAMGVVYQARDIKLSRVVALKRVKWGRVAADAQDRLVREALAMAQLAHPAVIGVFDAGVVDGAAYVAMEYVPGETLRAWLAVPRGWRAIAALFVETARGLAAAHAAGIVHGDFKPDNVLVDAHGRARIADFGLARLSSEGAAEHGFAGTPAYMAPELRPSPASDQFAWATSLYEALYGERPGRPASAPRRRGVPAAIARIAVRGLATDPAARFPSLTAAADALASVPRRRTRQRLAIAVGGAVLASGAAAWTLKHDAPPPCSDGSAELAAIWDPRALQARFAADGKAAIGTAVISTLDRYGARWSAARKSACEATRAGEQSSDLLDHEIYCLDQRRDSLREVVGVVTALRASELDKAMPIVLGLPPLSPCSDRAALLALPKLPEDPAARAELSRLESELERADAEANAARYPAARRRYEAVVAGAVRLGWPPLEAQAWLEIGHLELQLGNTEQGNAALGNAVDAASRARDDRLVASTLLKMLAAVVATTVASSETDRMLKLADAAVTRAGDVPELRAEYYQVAGLLEYVRYRRAEGAKLYDRALAIWEHLPGDHREPLARLRTSRAANAVDDGDLPRAQAELDKARAAMSEPLERSPNAGSYFGTSCMLKMFQQKLDEALAECTKARDLVVRQLGPDHPDTAASEGNLGSVLLRRGQGAEAVTHLERALDVTATAYGPDHPQTCSARKNLATTLGELGQHARARQLFADNLAAEQRAVGADHPKTLETATLLAGEEIGSGDAKAGIARLEEALPRLEAKLGRTHQLTITAVNSLAMAYQATGRKADAIATFRHAKELLVEQAGPDDVNVGIIMYNLAELAREAGRLDEALRDYDEVERIVARSLPRTHAVFGHVLTGRGEALLRAGRPRDAAAALEQALPIRTSAGDSAALAQTELALAEALLAMHGDRARAGALLETATAHIAQAGDAGAQWRARADKLRRIVAR